MLRALLAFIILPNLVFFIAAQFFYLDRPLINADYALLGALWLWLPPWLRVAGFAMAFIGDAIASTGRMYNISPVAGVVALMRAPWGLLITVILAFAFSVGLAAGIGVLLRRWVAARTSRLLLTTSCLAFLLGLAFLVPTRSSVARVVSDIVQRDRGYRLEPQRMAAATDALRSEVGAQSDNVAIVMVESWGVLSDSAAHARIISAFMTPEVRQRYRVRTGTIPFRGGTTSGELRELCGVETDYLVLNDRITAQCLPVQLQRHGFETVSLHGYKREYYSRHRWYPDFFDRSLFIDSLPPSDRRCGTQFRGICDADVFPAFKREVQREGGPRLVYWLTIDAHTPVDLERLREFPDLQHECAATEDVCLVRAFWRALFEDLAALAADPATPATRFVIVGDHAPAFVRRSRAAQFIPGRVPFVELMPIDADDVPLLQ